MQKLIIASTLNLTASHEIKVEQVDEEDVLHILTTYQALAAIYGYTYGYIQSIPEKHKRLALQMLFPQITDLSRPYEESPQKQLNPGQQMLIFSYDPAPTGQVTVNDIEHIGYSFLLLTCKS